MKLDANAGIVLAAFVLASSSLAVSQESPPKKLEDPFRVFVFHPPAEGFEKQAKAAVKTVADQIKRRKDWLSVVDSQEEAELLLEVYSQGIGKPGSTSSISGTMSVLSPSATGGVLGVREGTFSPEDRARLAPTVEAGHHFFETELSVLAMDSKVVVIGTASPNQRPSSAAVDLAKKIEQLVKDRYPELSKGR